MTEETLAPQEQGQPAATAVPADREPQTEDLPFYRIPAPPIPGKTAWSLSPWLPE